MVWGGPIAVADHPHASGVKDSAGVGLHVGHTASAGTVRNRAVYYKLGCCRDPEVLSV